MSDIEKTDTKNKLTIFQSPFSAPDNGKIKTLEFLTASKGIVTLLDAFGKVFIPVKSDMNGNISKLTNIYNTDINNNIYLDDMILKEKETSETIGTDALLWLVRGLHYVERFFELLVDDFENKAEDLVPILKIAYRETLGPYHGWIAQQLFGLIVRMCPSKTQLLQNLSSGSDPVKEEERGVIFEEMVKYTTRLKENVTVIQSFYKCHNLEAKVQDTC